MLSAILYLRVSTDEQANKGYSLKYQEDVLTQYCALKNITILKVYTEDHSAKNFNRPVWQQLISDIMRKVTQSPCLLLFTKWDRFSRSTTDSYEMIRRLQHLFIEPQAIEQPLDLSVPENKMMLAFYLAIPEVENDRRSINVKNGMQRAKQEGRWLGPAPLGYDKCVSQDGIKMLTIKEPEAYIIKMVFEQLSTGVYTASQVYRQAIKNGLSCGRSNFWTLIRNPVYAGSVRLFASDNKAYILPGLHLGIVSMETFDKVQSIINTKKRLTPKPTTFREQFFLKGFIF